MDENVYSTSELSEAMKKYFYFIFLILFACQPAKKEDAHLITVSILPQKYFIDQISGGLLKVNILVPPGSSPHNYEIMPSQMKDMARSKAWLQIGLLTFEDAWHEKMAQINKDLLMVDTSEGIARIAGIDDHHEGHEHEGAYDPHTWLAPAEVKLMAQNTLKALTKCYPDHAQEFEKNYTAFITKIDAISAEIDQKLASLKNRNILIFHPALAYYARQFKLEQIALEMDGKEPSPKHMKDVVDLAHAQDIHVIFIQKEFDAAFAKQMAQEIKGEVVVIDPLDYDWEKQMRDITEKIAGLE